MTTCCIPTISLFTRMHNWNLVWPHFQSFYSYTTERGPQNRCQSMTSRWTMSPTDRRTILISDRWAVAVGRSLLLFVKQNVNEGIIGGTSRWTVYSQYKCVTGCDELNILNDNDPVVDATWCRADRSLGLGKAKQIVGCCAASAGYVDTFVRLTASESRVRTARQHF